MPQANNSCAQPLVNCCDPDFVRSLFNLNEVLFPFTWRKPVWWLVTSTLLAGAIAIELTTHAFSIAAHYNSLVMMGIIYAIDPLIQFIAIITAQYPPALQVRENNLPTFEENFSDSVVVDIDHLNPDVAIVIPAHRAANKIEATIRSCLKHVGPRQIFIVDNGNSIHPLDETQAIVRRIDERINYIWGHIGNKTLAQYIGTLHAAGYRYIFTMDDDMRLPANFSFGANLINEHVKALCYSIIAVHPEANKESLLIKWQSLEYKMADCAKLSQSHFGGVLYPHGAASMWEREILLAVLKKHNAVFFAEDVQLGWLIERLGYKMKITAGSNLATEAPTSLFGPAPNFYQQRVRSWEMGRQVYFFRFLWQFLSVPPPAHSIMGKVIFKLYEAYAVYSNIVDWIRFPLFLLLLLDENYWIRLAIMTAASIIPLLIWNYIKLPLNQRSDLQSSFLQILSFPIFKLIESAMSVGAIFRLLWIFGPNYARKPNIEEMVDSIINDPLALKKEVSEEQAQRPQGMQLATYKKILCDLLLAGADDSYQSAFSSENDESSSGVYVNPLYQDDDFHSADSATESDDPDVVVVNPEENRRNGFFTRPRAVHRNPQADIALNRWLADLKPVKSAALSTTTNNPETGLKPSFFLNREAADTLSKGAVGTWLGSSLRGTLFQD